MMHRNQFTFYRSFWDAMQTIKQPTHRLMAYELIAAYALDGVEPDLSQLPGNVKMAYMLILPVLKTGRNKAANRMNKTKTNQQQNDKEGEKEYEYEYELEKELEYKKEYELESKKDISSDFERFWMAFPKKIGKEEAYREFLQAGQSVDVLLKAIEQQRSSPQWTKDGGQYIPSPAKWLKNKRWTDQVPHIQNPYGLSDLDLQAINRMMAHSGS